TEDLVRITESRIKCQRLSVRRPHWIVMIKRIECESTRGLALEIVDPQLQSTGFFIKNTYRQLASVGRETHVVEGRSSDSLAGRTASGVPGQGCTCSFSHRVKQTAVSSGRESSSETIVLLHRFRNDPWVSC